jgi:baculoviral IAP repeat-containing protein 7/8
LSSRSIESKKNQYKIYAINPQDTNKYNNACYNLKFLLLILDSLFKCTNQQTDANFETETMNYSREDVRLTSFDEHWTVPFIDKHRLAMFGFYYIGPFDRVKCFFCRVEINLWEPQDDVLLEHMRWSKNCDLINRKPTINIPINIKHLDRLLPDIRLHQILEPSTNERSVDDVGPFTFLQRNTHLKFSLESERLKSFENWPNTIPQKPEKLSDAGFYYTGRGDYVICFSCDGGLKDWTENDEPWEQHAIWYTKCNYLNLIKGREYIDAVLQHKKNMPTQNNSENSNLNPSERTQINGLTISSSNSSLNRRLLSDETFYKQTNDSRLCKICFDNECNTVFIPCGHIIACGKCGSSITKCPNCQQTFTNVMRVYFS